MEPPTDYRAPWLFAFRLFVLGLGLATAAGAGTPRSGSETGPSACAANDMDCRAFTGTLSWQPDDRRPLLSAHGLKRLVQLKGVGLGERERALRCLAFVAWAEARSDGVPGMRAVMAVVMNRSRDPAFPAHPCDVVAAAAAFEPMGAPAYRRTVEAVRDGLLPPFPRPDNVVEAAALRLARMLAWDLARNTAQVDPTFGATHFLAPAVLRDRDQPLPDWAMAYERTARIGGHDFFRRPLRLAREG
jgi:hypothetical protein